MKQSSKLKSSLKKACANPKKGWQRWVFTILALVILGGFVYATTIISNNEITTPKINSVMYVLENDANDITTKVSACPTDGCKIIIPCGVYNVNTNYVFRSNNTDLEGTGDCTVLNVTGGGFNILSYGNNFKFGNLRIEANNIVLNYSIRMLYFVGDYNDIHHLTINNLPNITLRVDGDGSRVHNNILRNVYQGLGNGGDAAKDGFKNFFIYDNVVIANSSNSWEGMDINQGLIYGEAVVYNNEFSNFSNQMLDIAISNVRIYNNVFRSTVTRSENAGIYIGGNINVTGVIEGNYFNIVNGTGLKLTSDNNQIKVVNNQFEGSKETVGVKVYGTNHIVFGNSFNNLLYGVYVYSTNGQMNSISMNNYLNTTYPFYQDYTRSVINSFEGVNNIQELNSSSIQEVSLDKLVFSLPLINSSLDSNNLIYEESGNNFVGVANGNLTIINSGMNSESAGQFSGNGFINFSLRPEVFSTEGFSACLWIKPYSIPSSSSAMYFMDNSKVFIGVRSSDRVNVFCDGSSDGLSGSVSTLTLNTWNHVCITVNSSGYSNFYINNILSNGDTSCGSIGVGTGDLFIGNRKAKDRPFNGSISDLVIFNRILNSQEINSIYNSRLKFSDPISNNLIVKPTTSTVCNIGYAGKIYFDNSTFKHYGCNSTTWNALY